MIKLKICPICGESENIDGIPYVDNFVFCGCCYFEFGFDDNKNEPLMNARKKWFDEGLLYHDNISEYRKVWTMAIAIKQLSNLILVDKNLWPEYVLNANRTWTPYFELADVERCFKPKSQI